MSFLGGIFARNNPGASKSNSSKTDLSHSSSPSNSHSGSPHLGPPASPSNSGSYYANPNGSNAGNSSYAASSQASSPTAEYVSFSAAGPSSPNGRGFAYAGESPLNNANARQRDGKDGKKSGLGFFGRKRSRNDLTPPASSLSPGYDGELDPPPNPGRPSYLSRLSTSSELPPTTANLSPTGSQSLRPGYWGTGSPSTRSLPPPSTSHSSSSLAPGGSGSHAYTGSPLAPSVSPTKSTATAKSAKSAGAKSGRRFAFWTRGKGTPPESPSPTKQGGGGKGGEESEFNLRSFRHVSPAAAANANSPPAGAATSYTNLNSSQTNLMGGGGSTAKLTASNLSSLELEMDLGGAPRRPRPRGGSDASASSGSRISVAAFREVHAQRQGRAPSPGPGMYGASGAGAGSQRDLHAQAQQRPGQGREQQTPTKGPPPPAKTTPGKHYRAPTKFDSSGPQQQKQGQGQPRKTSGNTRQPQAQWDSETSQSQEEEEEETDGGGGKGRAAKSEVGHGHGHGRGGQAQRREASGCFGARDFFGLWWEGRGRVRTREAGGVALSVFMRAGLFFPAWTWGGARSSTFGAGEGSPTTCCVCGLAFFLDWGFVGVGAAWSVRLFSLGRASPRRAGDAAGCVEFGGVRRGDECESESDFGGGRGGRRLGALATQCSLPPTLFGRAGEEELPFGGKAAFSWLDFSFGGAGVSLDAERSECGVLVGRRQVCPVCVDDLEGDLHLMPLILAAYLSMSNGERGFDNTPSSVWINKTSSASLYKFIEVQYQPHSPGDSALHTLHKQPVAFLNPKTRTVGHGVLRRN
ncbi:hypothetical protein B0H14DRAFT_3579455 [Mycena olivaceomarginata]|nr:hypothetical protein B0H14DRAFT_3579455 [Mycena olivaceomarginata]